MTDIEFNQLLVSIPTLSPEQKRQLRDKLKLDASAAAEEEEKTPCAGLSAKIEGIVQS